MSVPSWRPERTLKLTGFVDRLTLKNEPLEQNEQNNQEMYEKQQKPLDFRKPNKEDMHRHNR